MTSKTLLVLAGAAAVIAGGAYLVWSGRSGGVSSGSIGAAAALFPDLESKGDSVTSITVRSGGKDTIVHRLDKGKWGIASREDYPADMEKVHALVMALAQARIAEEKTSKPEYYERLGVQDPDATASTATLVTLKADQASLASIIIGNNPTTRGDNPMQAPLPGVFARKAGEARAVLLDKAIEVPKDAASWMKTDILTLDGQRVKRAVLAHAASEGKPATKEGAPAVDAKPAETLTLSKDTPEATGFSVAELPQGRALRTPTAPAPIATVLSYVTIEDAAAAKAVEGLTPATVGTFETFDGLVMEAKVFEKDGGSWLTLAARYVAPPKPEVPQEAKPDEAKPSEAKPSEAKPGEAKPDAQAEADKAYAATAEKVQKEVAELNARLAPWAFKIPDFKARQMQTRVEDLLIPLQPADGGAGDAPSAPPPRPPFSGGGGI